MALLVRGKALHSLRADTFRGIGVHLAARDMAFVTVVNSPLAEIDEYRERMGREFNRVHRHDEHDS